MAVGKYLEGYEEEPALVMAVDIGNFKIINDVYGHEAGDRALCYFTEDKKTFGKHIFIIRTGGDASSRLIKIMECGNLDDFMNYTCSHVFCLFPQGQEEGIQKEIERQMNRSDNRRRLYFVHAPMMTKKGNVKPVSMMGHLNHNANYGDLFYVFLYEERGKAGEAPGAV